ncbi:MAG: transcriptional repressor [Bacteroidia bacterium]|nr:transcriptional repressor [Bacteroidia bacterium]
MDMAATARTSGLLRKHDLRVTKGRTDILGIFLRQGIALSERELEDLLGDSCDRVTIYRTLTTFLEHGLLHRVPDDAGAAKYALCAGCAHQVHRHDHIHFKCTRCGQTTCVEEVRIPTPALPPGFILTEVSMLMQGICPACSGLAAR